MAHLRSKVEEVSERALLELGNKFTVEQRANALALISQRGRPTFGLMAAITKSMKARTFAAGRWRDGYRA
jgi:hypothetical protein